MSGPPDLIAKTDQRRAVLAFVVAQVRSHQAVCEWGESAGCCGYTVAEAIAASDRHQIETLLTVALGELARLPVPLSTIDGIDTEGEATVND